ncbi:4-demethylwyosine synthase TYW1 [Candidatus Woesearchaeota archaeon]|nr:4-demethylwyosine synthase TYW1 [Candidatus Woesearchaeota archaeon]
MDKKLESRLKKQHYYLAGNHSAVKICTWTKKSLKDEGACYKEKFYGIKSHRCCQMTPSFMCDLECIFCWRNMEAHTGIKMEGRIDEPHEIIDKCVEGQRKLLNGFPGNEKINIKKFREAQNPNQWAISLTGEPTIYPKLNELIKLLKKRRDSVFVVSNGMFPERLKNIEPPTNLYLSLDAPNKELFEKIDKPTQKNAWQKLNKSLEILKELKKKTTTVIRITLIKGMNDTDIKGYAPLIKKAEPNFVEVKSFMFVGSARLRLSMANMCRHEYVKEFAKKLSNISGYEIKDESVESRVCLLKRAKGEILRRLYE